MYIYYLVTYVVTANLVRIYLLMPNHLNGVPIKRRRYYTQNDLIHIFYTACTNIFYRTQLNHQRRRNILKEILLSVNN